MKKNNILLGIIILVVVLLLCGGVYFSSKGSYASDDVTTYDNVLETVNEKLSIDCGDGIFSPNEEVICTVKGVEFATKISSITMKLSSGSNLTVGGVTFNSDNWVGAGDNNEIDLFTDINKTGDFELFKFTAIAGNIAAGADTNVKLTNIVISDEEFDEYKINDISLNVRIASNIATLSNLSVTGGMLEFKPETTTYNLEIDSEEVTIDAIAANNKAIITGTGVKELNYGRNTFNIVVKAEDGTSKTYTLVITRPEDLKFASDVVVDDNNKYLIFVMDGFEFTVNNVLNKIITSGDIVIMNDENNSLTTKDYFGTGYKINIKLTTNQYNYTAIVLGDTNGDGKISTADVAKLFQYYRNKKTMGVIYDMSGDVVDDNEIKLNDVTKLFQYVRKTKDSLK